jgi:sarcosine oxidase
VSIRERTRVAAVIPDRAAVRVELTDGVTLRATAVVVAAGAWAPLLLDPLGRDIAATPTRETAAFFDFAADELPTMIDNALTPAGWRHRPADISYALAAPGEGLKVGLHHAGPVTDPDEAGQPDPDILAWASEWVSRRFSVAEPRPARAETCIYTNRADASFVLERRGRIVVGAACSGHGFKFAPLHGRTLADLALEGMQG